VEQKPQRTGIRLGPNATGNTFRNVNLGGYEVGIDNDGERNEFYDVELRGSEPLSPQKQWYEKPLGILILAVISGVIIAGITYFFGWN
jgi:hypothetical protein